MFLKWYDGFSEGRHDFTQEPGWQYMPKFVGYIAFLGSFSVLNIYISFDLIKFFLSDTVWAAA